LIERYRKVPAILVGLKHVRSGFKTPRAGGKCMVELRLLRKAKSTLLAFSMCKCLQNNGNS